MFEESQNPLKESFSSQIQQQYPQQFKDQFKCPICQAKYNLNDRYPISTCIDQHHACLSCIENLIKDNEVCRICQKPYEKGLINKNKLIGNLLFKSASLKGLKVKIIDNPQQKIKKLLPDSVQYNPALNNNKKDPAPVLNGIYPQHSSGFNGANNSSHALNPNYQNNRQNNNLPAYQPNLYMYQQANSGFPNRVQNKLNRFQVSRGLCKKLLVVVVVVVFVVVVVVGVVIGVV